MSYKLENYEIITDIPTIIHRYLAFDKTLLSSDNFSWLDYSQEDYAVGKPILHKLVRIGKFHKKALFFFSY